MMYLHNNYLPSAPQKTTEALGFRKVTPPVLQALRTQPHKQVHHVWPQRNSLLRVQTPEREASTPGTCHTHLIRLRAK
jgi:hypothetical protein